MSTDRIERDILIEAPVDVVWRVVTQPEHIARWFSDAVELDLRPGGEGRLVWQPQATNEGLDLRISVVAVDPPRAWSYRWMEAEGESGSLLVELTLAPEGDGTRLRVVESGMLAMPWAEEKTADYVRSHMGGWERHLALLRDCAVEQVEVPAPR